MRTGTRSRPPAAATGRAVTEILDGDRRVAAIVHDAALEDDRAFIDTATSYALMTLDNHRLSAQTSSLLRAVRESRARIQAAADDERRRIERDLHDGAQQRLVALRIKLELAAERTDDGHANGDEGAAVLRGLGGDVEEALEEVRSLARGIYPAPLADRGLVEGLRAAALRNPLPTTVLAAGDPAPLARDRERRLLLLPGGAAERGEARGGRQRRGDRAVGRRRRPCASRCATTAPASIPATVAGGVGFTNMRDRVAAVNGELTISSSPGPRDARDGDDPAPHAVGRGASTTAVGMPAGLAAPARPGRLTPWTLHRIAATSRWGSPRAAQDRACRGPRRVPAGARGDAGAAAWARR